MKQLQQQQHNVDENEQSDMIRYSFVLILLDGCTGSTRKFSQNFEIHICFHLNSKNKTYSETNTICIEWHHTFDEYII